MLSYFSVNQNFARSSWMHYLST